MKFNIILKEKRKSSTVFQYACTNKDIIYRIKHPYGSSDFININPDNIPYMRFGYASGNFNNNYALWNNIKITGMSHLLLDFDQKHSKGDSGIIYNLIDKFIEKFKDYEFYLYTTKSSTQKIHSFRVIFPLKYMVRIETVRRKSEELLKFFTIYDVCGKSITADSSCIVKNYQMAPYCKDNKTYRYYINKGKKFEIKTTVEEDINFKSFEPMYMDNNMDSTFWSQYYSGKEIFRTMLEEGKLSKKFHMTPGLKKRYYKYSKYVASLKNKGESYSLASIVNHILEKRNENKDGFTVASVLAWVNYKNNDMFNESEVKKAYKEIRNKEMSSDKLLKYYSFKDKLLRGEYDKN